MNKETFLRIFGEIDDTYIQRANEDVNLWQRSQEGEVVRPDDSRRFPWRTVIASVACAAAVVFGAFFLMRNVLKNGFTLKPADSTNSSSVQGGASNSDGITDDELTFLVGPDGKTILKSEITRLENTDKTVETLTENDWGADIYCEGFAYYKLPCGFGYDSYKNPELFDGSDFLGKIPENKNEWKRVNVGDEICGLKVVSATAHFRVRGDDFFPVPERHFYDNDMGIELEGTVEAEGFLRINNPIDDNPAISEEIWFYPSAVDLPLTPTIEHYLTDEGFETRFEVRKLYELDGELFYAGEYDYIALGRYSDIDCDMDGLGVGEVAYARVTFGDIRCSGNQTVSGTLEKVELLSGVLAKETPV